MLEIQIVEPFLCLTSFPGSLGTRLFFAKVFCKILFLLLLQATDKDLGQNSEIEYTLEEGNLGSVFNIEGERYKPNQLISRK